MTQAQELKFKVGDVVKVELAGGKVEYGIVYESDTRWGYVNLRVQTLFGKLKDLNEEQVTLATMAETQKAWNASVVERIDELTPEKIIARETAEHPELFGESGAEGQETPDEDE
jgi:anaerobic selenocysteine-containing dehydrogenase